MRSLCAQNMVPRDCLSGHRILTCCAMALRALCMCQFSSMRGRSAPPGYPHALRVTIRTHHVEFGRMQRAVGLKLGRPKFILAAGNYSRSSA
eukprot:SAG11_NODE_2699_length_3077_cov_2.064473_2_plen_92_part_00